MIDVVDQSTRSRMMAGIKGKNTRPELLVRQYLHRRGFRYRLHVRSLPGSPDIVLPKWKTAIFVHGCFWHRHRGCRFTTMPATNSEWWQRKFGENIDRDQRSMANLVEAGWRVIVLWECGLRAIQGDESSLHWLENCILYPEAENRIVEWPQVEV